MAKERELPPALEMMCLNALWNLGEANVEDVRRTVSAGKPLAYTTVLTLMDRLTRRGAVARRKEGRGFRYHPVAERDKLRLLALRHMLESHFDSSVETLRTFLDTVPAETSPSKPADGEPPRAFAAYVGAPAPAAPPRE